MFLWPNTGVQSVIIFMMRIKKKKNFKNFLIIGDVQFATHLTPDELPKSVDKALSTDEPVIVDINTDPMRFI